MHTLVSLLFLSSSLWLCSRSSLLLWQFPSYLYLSQFQPSTRKPITNTAGEAHDSIPFNIFLLPVARGCQCLETGRRSFPDLVWWSHKGQCVAETSVTQRHCDETRPPEASATGRFKDIRAERRSCSDRAESSTEALLVFHYSAKNTGGEGRVSILRSTDPHPRFRCCQCLSYWNI